MLRRTKKVAVATTTASGTAVKRSRAIAVQSVYIGSFARQPCHYLSKRCSTINIRLSVTVSVVSAVSFVATPLAASTLTSLEANMDQCLRFSSVSHCQRGIDQAEVLQRAAASKSQYPCQTLLLGLQADLIMEQLGTDRELTAFQDFMSLKRSCSGL